MVSAAAPAAAAAETVSTRPTGGVSPRGTGAAAAKSADTACRRTSSSTAACIANALSCYVAQPALAAVSALRGLIAHARSGLACAMEEVPVAFADNTWAPAQAYYWPKNGSLTFIAYSPASKASYAEATDSGITFTNYDVSTTVTEQVDLMFSERAYNKKAVDDNEAGSGDTSNDSTVTGDPYKGVHLSFKHALSSVAFTAKTAADYSGSTTITLNKIELVNVGSIASFDQNLADANNAPTTAAAWTATTGPVTYVVDNDDDLAQVLNTTAWWSANKSTTAPAKADGLRDTDFILLPQDLSANNVKIKITYTLDNAGAGSEALVQVIEQDLATAAVSKWEMGKRYIYNIIVGLDTIFFEPYVADWEDVPAGGAGQNFNF
ncbi:MAG: fimbrillin family protein [Tidjanibacter sp.]|nr:fimbrillin family protein [Tidjanibacter sp.]